MRRKWKEKHVIFLNTQMKLSISTKTNLPYYVLIAIILEVLTNKRGLS